MKREFSGFNFDLIGAIDPERGPDGNIQEFMPEAVTTGLNKSPVSPHLRGPFCRFYISTDFPHPGVYAITVNGEVSYINECQNLSERFNSLGYGTIYPHNAFFIDKVTKCCINRLILENARQSKIIELWFLRNLRERKDIKEQLIRHYHPDWNDRLAKASG